MTDMTDRDTPQGIAYALAAYAIWATMPLFFKLIGHIPTFEILAHRVAWSLPIALVVMVAIRRTDEIVRALKSPRLLAMGLLTATVISINWGVYVWAVNADRATEAALGYYINPLLNIALAAVFLGEKLSRVQIVAVGLAALAVVISAWGEGGLPWVSLVLPASFSLYGLLRRMLPIGPAQGFFVEVLILFSPAAAYIIWLEATGTGHFSPAEPFDFLMLLFCGPMTAVPLLLFAYATKMLRFATVGILQYVTPTAILLIAIFVFGEPFSHYKLVAFVLIWSALILYSLPLVKSFLKKD